MSGLRDEWNEKEIAELKKIFYVQAYETVEELQDAMLRLESNPGDDDALKTVKRQIHTLKGDSNSIGLSSIGTLCHRIEDVLAELMRPDRMEDHEPLDILFASIDVVYRMLTESEAGKEPEDGREIIVRIERFLAHVRSAEGRHDTPSRVALSEYQQLQIHDALKKGLHVYDIEVEFHSECSERSVAALMVVRQLAAQSTIIHRVPDPETIELAGGSGLTIILSTKLDEASIRSEACVTGMTVRVDVHERQEFPARELAGGQTGPQPMILRSEVLKIETSKVDAVMDLVGELIIGRSMIDQVARELGDGLTPGEAAARLQAANSYFERIVSDLQKGVMKMRMVPIRSVFRKFPRMVRDLCAAAGKKAGVELIGSETELDKGIVDALGEPLAHLVRNAVDHAIELTEERRLAGKPEEARISLKAYHEASQIVIEVADDGGGIDREQLIRKAIENNYLSHEDAAKLSEGEASNLVFLSGLSTASTVTETSGRGVGMDAVRSVIESHKGTIQIETAKGSGTLFRLRLPLTLAIINALLFEVGSRLYAVPVPAIREVCSIMSRDLVTVDGRKTLLLRDQIISIVSLQELFGGAGNGKEKKYVLVLAVGGRKTGLLIDRLMWQQELVIKPIDAHHMQTEFITGASVLGSGKVILILDVHSIMKKAIELEKKKGLVML